MLVLCYKVCEPISVVLCCSVVGQYLRLAVENAVEDVLRSARATMQGVDGQVVATPSVLRLKFERCEEALTKVLSNGEYFGCASAHYLEPLMV